MSDVGETIEIEGETFPCLHEFCNSQNYRASVEIDGTTVQYVHSFHSPKKITFLISLFDGEIARDAIHIIPGDNEEFGPIAVFDDFAALRKFIVEIQQKETKNE